MSPRMQELERGYQALLAGARHSRQHGRVAKPPWHCVHRAEQLDTLESNCPDLVPVFRCRCDGVEATRCVIDPTKPQREAAVAGGLSICRDCPHREADFVLPDRPQWSVAMTVGQRRQPTVARTLASLRDAGWDAVDLFVEPSAIEQLDTPPGIVCTVHENDQEMGAWRNFRQAIRFASRADGADVVLMMQDDVLLARGSRQWWEDNWPVGGEFTSLYCSSRYHGHGPWIAPGAGDALVGGLTMALAVNAARHFTNDTYAAEQTQNNRHVDIKVGRWLARTGRQALFANPSRAQHIGDTSAIYRQATNSRSRRAATFEAATGPGTVTAVLTVYRRPHTFAEQVTALRDQSSPPDAVWAFVNDVDHLGMAEAAGVDRVVACTPNSGYFLRFAVAMEAQTEFVAMFDDDAVIGRRWLENCHATFAERPAIVTTFGRRRSPDDPLSYKATTAAGNTNPNEDAVAVDWGGGAWFLRPEWLAYLFQDKLTTTATGEDMQLCMRAAAAAGVPTVVAPHPASDVELWGNMRPLRYGADAAASYLQPGFVEAREALLEAETRGDDAIVGSHKPVLEVLLRTFRPDQVVEVGSGLHSTPLFVSALDAGVCSSVVSIETSPAWAARVRRAVGHHDGWQIIECDTAVEGLERAGVASNSGLPDLVFVDGVREQRLAAINAAAAAGVPHIVVHDADKVRHYRLNRIQAPGYVRRDYQAGNGKRTAWLTNLPGPTDLPKPSEHELSFTHEYAEA